MTLGDTDIDPGVFLSYPIGKTIREDKTILADDEKLSSIFEVTIGSGGNAVSYYLAGVVLKETGLPVGTIFTTELMPKGGGGGKLIREEGMKTRMSPQVI
jgi:hypothetical protein